MRKSILTIALTLMSMAVWSQPSIDITNKVIKIKDMPCTLDEITTDKWYVLRSVKGCLYGVYDSYTGNILKVGTTDGTLAEKEKLVYTTQNGQLPLLFGHKDEAPSFVYNSSTSYLSFAQDGKYSTYYNVMTKTQTGIVGEVVFGIYYSQGTSYTYRFSLAGSGSITREVATSIDILYDWRVYEVEFVDALVLSEERLYMCVGDERQIATTVNLTSGGTIAWTSSDPSIATVDETGKVSAIAEGTVTITATLDGVSQTCVVTVLPQQIDLVDGQDFTIANTIDHVSTLTYTRNFKNTSWQALYVPFDMEYSQWEEDFDIARINDVHQDYDYTTGTLNQTKLEIAPMKSGSIVKANTPYLIKAHQTGEKTITLTDATLETATENTFDVSSWYTLFTFKGNYTTLPAATMVAEGYYAMGGGALVQSNGSTGLGSYRWHMQVTDRNGNPVTLSSGVKLVVIDEWGQETEADGIRSIDNGLLTTDNAIYDLSGRRVEKAAKGLYVKNGQKVLVR